MTQIEIFRASFSLSDSLKRRLQFLGGLWSRSVAPCPLFVRTEPEDNVNPVPAAGGIDGVLGDQLLVKGRSRVPGPCSSLPRSESGIPGAETAMSDRFWFACWLSGWALTGCGKCGLSRASSASRARVFDLGFARLAMADLVPEQAPFVWYSASGFQWRYCEFGRR